MVSPHRPLSVITSPSRGRNCFPQTSRNHLLSPPRSPSALTDTSQTLALTRLVSPISRPLQEVSRRLRRLENQGFRIAGIPGENSVTSAGKAALGAQHQHSRRRERDISRVGRRDSGWLDGRSEKRKVCKQPNSKSSRWMFEETLQRRTCRGAGKQRLVYRFSRQKHLYPVSITRRWMTDWRGCGIPS